MTIFSHSFQVQDTNPLRTFTFMLQSKRQVPDAQHTRNMFVVHEQGQAGDPAVPTRSPGGPCTKASSAQSWHLSGRGWHQQGPQGREGAGQTSWGWDRRAPWCPHAARPLPSWSTGKPAVFLQGGRVGSVFPKEKEAVDGGEWGEIPPRACNTDSPFWGTQRGCTTLAPPAATFAWASLRTAQQQRQDSCPARLQACPGKGKMPPKGLDGLNYHYLTRGLKRGLWPLRPARALSSLITGRSLNAVSQNWEKRKSLRQVKLLASGSASPDVQPRGPGRAPPAGPQSPSPAPPEPGWYCPAPTGARREVLPGFVLCAASYVANASIRFPASGGGERGSHGDRGEPPRKPRTRHRAALAEPRCPDAGTRGPRRGPERAGSQACRARSPKRVPAGSEQLCVQLINVQVVKPFTKTWIKIHETKYCIQTSTEESGREGTRAACTPHGLVLAGPRHGRARTPGVNRPWLPEAGETLSGLSLTSSK